MPTSPHQSTYPPAGTPVYIRFGLIFRHHGIVSDRRVDGAPRVISNSRRAGGVVEETWSVFADGMRVRRNRRLTSNLRPAEIVRRARAWSGRPYDVLFRNCDHHVRHALGLAVQSPQLQSVVAVAALAGAALAARR